METMLGAESYRRIQRCSRAVGDFPEVDVGPKWFGTRVLTAFGAGLAPIL